MPLKEELLSGRTGQNLNNYFYIICYFFVRQVTGCSRFDQALSSNKPFYSITTASDEAFALSVLANNYDKWVFKCQGGTVPQGATMPPPRFTCGSGKKAKKYQGWSNEGLAYYATLAKELQDIRCEEIKAAPRSPSPTIPVVTDFDRAFADYWCMVTGKQQEVTWSTADQSVEAQAAALANFDYDFPVRREPLQRGS
jgi:hypothetical protein